MNTEPFRMSPHEIRVLMHIYSGCGAFERTGLCSPATDSAIARFYDAQLIAPTPAEQGWTTTSRGDAFVAMLKNTPLPCSKWVDPRTGAAYD